VLRPMEVRPVRTSVQSPWQNGVAERWVGSCRRELLDHVIVLNKQHRHRMLHEDLESYHNDRTSLSDLLHPTNRAATPCRSHHLFRLALARSSDRHRRPMRGIAASFPKAATAAVSSHPLRSSAPAVLNGQLHTSREFQPPTLWLGQAMVLCNGTERPKFGQPAGEMRKCALPVVPHGFPRVSGAERCGYFRGRSGTKTPVVSARLIDRVDYTPAGTPRSWVTDQTIFSHAR